MGSLDAVIDKFEISKFIFQIKKVNSDSYYNLIQSCSMKNIHPQFLEKEMS
ncbi:hypothetical protein Q5M85_08215 [Paraclostridium bifermentans]|nr:hypothetical protein [Paraclostridium bifermentans]